MAEVAAAGARQCVVVGAGIVGTCCALYLQREGFAVTLIDREPPGEQCSSGNGGNLGYASCVPLSTPGIWRRLPRFLFDPDSPLVIRLRHLPRLTPWLLRFTASSAAGRVEAIADGRWSLLSRLYDAYEPLLRDAQAQDLIHRGGLLYTWESEAAFAEAQYTMELRHRRGVKLEWLSGEQAREIEPALAPTVVRAVFAPEVSQVVNPLRLTQCLVRAFQRNGGRLLRDNVTGFRIEGGAMRGVVAAGGSQPAELVVIAAGAWSRDLTAQLGCRLPLEAERGYHLMISKPAIPIRNAVLSADRSIGATPMENGLRIVGISELASIDVAPDYRLARRIGRLAEGLFPGIETGDGVPWMGARPSMPNSLPVIGQLPGRPDVLLAFGHDHIGLATAAITGRLVSQLAAGKPTDVDMAPYGVDRFRSRWKSEQ